MEFYNFLNDYSEGAHPSILDELIATNLVQQEGYGDDDYCKQAADLIRKEIGNLEADIHFVAGGTQANMICSSAFLKPYESIVAPKTAHIEIHEAGAIEFAGHKINTVEAHNGKILPAQIEEMVKLHYDEHMVVPKLVFISNTTELGSVYKKDELQKLSEMCKKHGLYLYIDGARLGAALTANSNDLSLSELNQFADAYYIGGTKNGALIGEAIVINNPALKERFRYNMKQKGALIAKGRIIGIQFKNLFTDGLYYKLAAHANLMAEKLANGLADKNYKFLLPPESNQVFPILPNELIEKLEKNFGFYIWTKYNESSSVVRLVCSWATDEKAVDEFLKAI
ncbi:MAG: low specificity L-threonine aldolase [Bacteroidales bacterium]|jgi:threonine aldolase|nr:low specificity L-threonine aldolase [Bacteroidales bacterium]